MECSATIYMFVYAANHAPALTRSALVSGLDAAGPIDFSFPAGPARFDRSGVVAGGQFWRPVIYDASCPCFKVANPNFKPNFQ